MREGCATESIEGFIEDLAFSQSYDLAPSQSPTLLLNWIVTQGKTEKERKHSAGREEGGVGRGVKSYDSKKAWFSINRSILSLGEGQRANMCSL